MSCIVKSRYLSMTNEETEDFMCSVIVGMSRVHISETAIDICSYELQASNNPIINANPMSDH